MYTAVVFLFIMSKTAGNTAYCKLIIYFLLVTSHRNRPSGQSSQCTPRCISIINSLDHTRIKHNMLTSVAKIWITGLSWRAHSAANSANSLTSPRNVSHLSTWLTKKWEPAPMWIQEDIILSLYSPYSRS